MKQCLLIAIVWYVIVHGDARLYKDAARDIGLNGEALWYVVFYVVFFRTQTRVQTRHAYTCTYAYTCPEYLHLRCVLLRCQLYEALPEVLRLRAWHGAARLPLPVRK